MSSCSGGHPPGLPALPRHARHHRHHPHRARPPDGRRQCTSLESLSSCAVSAAVAPGPDKKKLAPLILGQEEKARVIQTLLFVAGINTLIQSFLGTRLPAVIGGSYTFVMPTISIVLAGRYSGIADPHEVCASLQPSIVSLVFALLECALTNLVGCVCRNSCASCGGRRARS